VLGLGAELVYTDGSTTPITHDLVWTFSDTSVVTTNDDNIPVATGLGSSQVLAVALHQGLYAECSVTIKLLLPDPVIVVDMTDEEVATFESMETGEGDGAVFWQYPFDGTVFPRGMYPPLLQWWPGNANYFRVRLVNSQGLTVTFYTKESQVQPTRELWQVIGQVPNGEIQMHLTGAEYLAPGGVVWEATTRYVISADATLGGSVYYWEATAGDIMRLDSEDYEPIAEPVFSTNSATGECRGCHTLSPDGAKLAYNFNAKANGDLGMAWAKNPEPEIMGLGSGIPSTTMAFGPAGNLLVVADDIKMWLGDVTPGTPGGIEELLTIEDTADSGGMYMADAPSWSRDGSALVYGRRDVGFDVLGSSLQRRYWDAETQTFGEAVELLSPEDVPTGNLLMYPSWSPDSKWVVARVSDQLMGKGDTTTSSLILVDGISGDWVSLDTAGPQDFAHGRPSFSPFMEGGYYWLVFYSTQPYGESDTVQKQLWVMAIDQDATTGADPSHPPFWLPGQNLEAANISAFWSKPVCTYEGELCLSDEDCCVGLECAVDADLGVGFCESVGCTVPGEY
ncbi:MAG: hypothetical protein VX938_01230, partial [Myxococcota bacterium]|nr:hypothetical protein [Myxococcota bacterium]